MSKIKELKEELMKQAQDWCDDNDKSTEFMIQYMQDKAKVSFETVMNFLEKQAVKS